MIWGFWAGRGEEGAEEEAGGGASGVEGADEGGGWGDLFRADVEHGENRGPSPERGPSHSRWELIGAAWSTLTLMGGNAVADNRGRGI